MFHPSFPTSRDNWSLDIVNILAVLGEHNIEATSQLMCRSRFCFIPRLLPAPQGLLARRPIILDSDGDVEVVSIYSGNRSQTLRYFGKILHGDGSWLPPNTTRILHITSDAEEHPIQPRKLAPLNFIAVISCLLSLANILWAIALGDGVALTGILIMSFTTPLLCVGQKWTITVPWRPSKISQNMPKGDVVYRNANGGITVVHCDDSVARALYFHPERPEYLADSFQGRTVSGIVGGTTLVGSIILFGNAQWTLKAALVVTYTILNLLYWMAAILPARNSWYLNFKVEEEVIKNDTYTKGVWSAIRATRTTSWVRQGDFVPKTEAWDEWVHEAHRVMRTNNEPSSWDPTEALRRLIFTAEENRRRERDHDFV